MNQIIECIPNFSEGRNPARIKEIQNAIESVHGIKLLDVSSGISANRTVITFAGDPESVMEAAFRGIEKASQLIDMSKHEGVHPRFGATDVCPLVPVSNITMSETVEYARQLAERVGRELSIPVYCYENAAFREERQSLASCRRGGYENLRRRLLSENDKPDFGPFDWSASVGRTGAVAIGARNFLIAYNINLNTTSTRLANQIALEVRESGKLRRNSANGEVITGIDGAPERIPGTLKNTRAIGWYIDDFGIAQVSMNLTDLSVTPVHLAFEEVSQKAADLGLRVTGSELVGLIPLESLIDAGKYFLRKQKRSTGIADEEIIKIAVRSLGLDDLQPFDPHKKIIDYLLDEDAGQRLSERSVSKFINIAASESLGPGGGAVSAAVGAMGAALAGMAANLSAQKSGWIHRWEEFSAAAEKAKEIHLKLLTLIDEDAKAFIQLYNALKLPVVNIDEAPERDKIIAKAAQNAVEVPLLIMQNASNALDVLLEMAHSANPNTISDIGAGACCAKAAVDGAFLTVKLNAATCSDIQFGKDSIIKAENIIAEADGKHRNILKIANEKIQDLKHT